MSGSLFYSMLKDDVQKNAVNALMSAESVGIG